MYLSLFRKFIANVRSARVIIEVQFQTAVKLNAVKVLWHYIAYFTVYGPIKMVQFKNCRSNGADHSIYIFRKNYFQVFDGYFVIQVKEIL